MSQIDTLQIVTGEKRIAINSDPERIISFNPTDVLFVERFYSLLAEAEIKSEEYKTRAKLLEQDKQIGENGLPANIKERIDLLKESCIYLREQIDGVFGAGTSQKAFGDAFKLDMFGQFFDGIKPYFQKARAEKIAKYTTDASAKRDRRSKK